MNSNIFRIIAFFVVLSVLPFSSAFTKSVDFKNLQAENIKIYFSEKIDIDDVETFENGIGCYVIANQEQANKFILSDCFSGITFESKLSTGQLLKKLNAKIISKQNININDENTTIIYAYTNNFSEFVVLKGEKVNIQIALREDIKLIGMPLLLGSY